MTLRVPLVYNGSQLQQMKTSNLNNMYSLGAYYYSLSPSRTLTVSGSGGNLPGGSINDTRLKAGAASTSAGSFPSESTTAEPSVVTVNYNRITQHGVRWLNHITVNTTFSVNTIIPIK